MRDLVTRVSFRMRKSLDDFLFWMLPTSWVPLYNAVSFSTAPYKQCQQHRQWQDKVINRILMAMVAMLLVAVVLSVRNSMATYS